MSDEFPEARSVKNYKIICQLLEVQKEADRSGNSVQWWVQNKSFCSKGGWCRPPNMPGMQSRLWCYYRDYHREAKHPNSCWHNTAVRMKATKTRQIQSRRVPLPATSLIFNIKLYLFFFEIHNLQTSPSSQCVGSGNYLWNLPGLKDWG